jgi:peptidase M28-like protein/PA domain-containing protein/Big-like domain-containing protein
MRRTITLPLALLLSGLAIGCSNGSSTNPPPTSVGHVSVTLAVSALTTGVATQATAVTTDSLGAALTGRTVTWSSSATTVATVSSTGLVTAVGAGTANITATSEGVSGFATVTVTEVQATGCVSRNFTAAADLVGCITQDGLWAHMVAFQQIADANPGSDGYPSRNSGEPGYLASVNYAANLLRAAGYRVTIQQYDYAYSGWASVPLLSVVSPTPQTFALGPDFYPASTNGGGAAGDVTAQIQPAGGIIIPAPATQNTSSSGCTAADFTGFVPGRIALIQGGTCTFYTKVLAAQQAGAVGAILFNEGSPGAAAAFSCRQSGLSIPVICVASFAVGQTLYHEAQLGATTARVRIQPLHDIRPDYNLIADSPYGDTSHVVVVDAHLDAIYGAGMLDNASGSATILEIALKMATTHTTNQLRYIWFGGEETGLHGSIYYTHALAPADLARIVFDVDADVTATPNYVYAIADPATGCCANIVTASQVGNNYFSSYFTAADLPFDDWNNVGTDSYSFAQVGVPNTGILTGQDCCKSAADVAKFGGFTGNYEGNIPSTDGGCVDNSFRWCDNLSNNDPVVLTTVSKAFASVVFNLANNATLGAPRLRRSMVAPGILLAKPRAARTPSGPIR